jgi:lysophospholipase L1-like esterase
MRKATAFVLTAFLFLFFSCGSKEEAPLKLVAIGDSTVMGIQDMGLVVDYQQKSFPYLIAKQLGIAGEFEQPYVRSPGISSPPYERPLELQNGQIIASYLPENITQQELFQLITQRLDNALLERPYDNLGIGGAQLFDMRNTTGSRNSVRPNNIFFDVVLRNLYVPPYPYFDNTTVLQQAAQLEPNIILLWIGNNDILQAVTKGGDEDLITDPTDFREEFIRLLNDLRNTTSASIIMGNVPGYLPYGYALDKIFIDGLGPVVFSTTNFEPIDFREVIGEQSPVYIPLLLKEDNVKHLTLNAGVEYLENGMGIPDEEILKSDLYKFSPEQAKALVSAMTAQGLNTAGVDFGNHLKGENTITESEKQVILDTIGEYNLILEDLSSQFKVPLVDIHHLWDPDADVPFGGYSGEFVLFNQENTIFSLDGVHVNNLGHALLANAFIDVMNDRLQMGIQKLDPEDYRGQYIGKDIKRYSIKALKEVKNTFF